MLLGAVQRCLRAGISGRCLARWRRQCGGSCGSDNATRHVIVSESDVLLSEVVAKEICVSVRVAEELIDFGSVYVNEKPEVRHSPTKRQRTDIRVDEGMYVRVYPQPQTIDVTSVDWTKSILYESDEFVVINKPSGIPCGPTTSNYHQNVMECVRKTIQCDKLFIPHRLDVATSGILVFGKSKAFARDFGKAIRRQELVKTYKLVVMNDVEILNCGDDYAIKFPQAGTTLTNYMEHSRFYPKILHDEEVPESKICLSEVKYVSSTICRPKSDWLHFGKCDKLKEAVRTWCNQGNMSKITPEGSEKQCLALCEVQLKLVTGRTHQLRAQVLATGHGNAIAGDEVYSPLTYLKLLNEQSEQEKKKNPHNPSLISSPQLALQAFEIEAVGESRHLLDGRAHSVPQAFWSSIFS